MRFDRIRVVALAGALLAAACSSSSRSFIVLTLQTSGTTQIADVDEVVVKVSKGTTEMKTLTYPASALTLDAVKANTLSVNFSDDESGTIHFDVDASSGGCVVGHGEGDKEIAPKDIAYLTVTMTPVAGCNADGGADGGPEGGVFPGCDPVSPTTCGANQTCQVNCATGHNECTAGNDNGVPGTVCTGNPDCQAGTQCFDYAGLGCNVKVCLRFCNNGGDCSAFGAGGAGPGSLCEGPVQCGGEPTAYHTCTFNCDPRAVATATRGGCPVNLACVALAGMDQVDCTCPGSTRTKDVGESCSAGGADCKPGLVCNHMGSTNSCRAICRCDAANDSCTAPNDCTGGTQCRPVTNSTIYGVCL
jgi:hypothetical protein